MEVKHPGLTVVIFSLILVAMAAFLHIIQQPQTGKMPCVQHIVEYEGHSYLGKCN